MSETTIETKACKNCSKEFQITDKDLEFYKRVSPTLNGVKHEIPSPTFCPDCRQQRRSSYINQERIYRRKCDLTGKPIIAIYSTECESTIYDQAERWSDKWDGLDFGRDFDFSKPFFPQFAELRKVVPYPNLLSVNSENCEFNDGMDNCKNCYMCFGNTAIEDCYYTYGSTNCHNCSDVWWSGDCANCYETSNTAGNFKTMYAYNSNDCSDSRFIRNCENVQDCFMCYGIQNKKNCIKNVQYSKEEYEAKMKEYQTDSYEKLQGYIKEFEDFVAKQIHPNMNQGGNEDCTGDYIYASKNSHNCFHMVLSEDSKNVYEGGRGNDMMDCSNTYFNEGNLLECCGVFGCYNIRLSEFVYGESRDILYCSNMNNCKDCFGCVGLRDKQYCVFNKQYTKEDYEKLVSDIIAHMKTTGEWGEFFPSYISPYGYNETSANDYYPLTDEEAKAKGYNWLSKEYPINIPPTMKTVSKEDLPDSILPFEGNIVKLKTSEAVDILQVAIICELSGRPFRITQSELELYRKLKLPLPRQHPNTRHVQRMKINNPRTIYDRTCDKCNAEMKTTYAPDRPEIVYCEECYRDTIYG